MFHARSQVEETLTKGQNGAVSDAIIPSDDLDIVMRWQASGGEIEVLDWGPPIVIALCTCDGGQEMQRIVSSAPDVLAHLETE